MEAPAISFDRAKLARFKKRFKEYSQNSEILGDTFTFDGHEFQLGYAKYLIEYLEDQMEGRS